MKRVISILLLLFFLSGNSHAIINIHYCGGKFQSVSLVAKAKACGMCNKEASKNCCKDVQKVIKADDFSKVSSDWNLKPFFISLVFITYKSFSISVFDYHSSEKYAYTGNTIKQKTPTFIRICSLII